MNVLDLNHQNINKFGSMIKGNCVILFHHPQCGHCKELRPTWERLKHDNKTKPVNIMEINADMLNTLNHPIKHSVKGFPQIMRLENGKVTEEFNEPRSLENLNNFVRRSTNRVSNHSNMNRGSNHSNMNRVSNRSNSKKSNSKKSKSKKSNSKKSKSKKSKPKKSRSSKLI